MLRLVAVPELSDATFVVIVVVVKIKDGLVREVFEFLAEIMYKGNAEALFLAIQPKRLFIDLIIC